MKSIKKTIIFLLAALPFGVLAQEQNFTIQGSVKDINVPVAKAYVLYKFEGYGDYHRDSAMVVKGKFTIKGKIPYAMKGTVFISPSNRVQEFPYRLDQKDIYLENGIIKISADSLKTATVTSTKLNADFHKLTQLLAPFLKEEEDLHVAERNAWGKDAKLAEIKEMRADMTNRKLAMEEAFVKSHLNSLVALDILPEAIDPAYNLAKAKTVFQKFSPGLRASVGGKRYEKSFAIAIGVQAPDFSSKTVEGEEISLSSYRGKYVLIDFWASWCMPCRAQNPGLVKTYNKYKDQNFKVLGVSLDAGKKGKEMWLKAIAMDHLPWDQVSDLTGGFNSSYSQLYQITAVPTNFLIDPSGKIIGKNLHGEELEAKLAEIYPKSK
ncbi:alkyl hydroperoxide reductase [Pedobacter sp. HMWF019]|uniref:TlpA disulfide reductase family protein n=1 Tax=Pedobacter sp. HMWF019 TaxID=2056856 RepID=UPI000D370411|nr:TlpA disulfide reductase family protein [Pedobacter sp. HMWF019]PTT00069.1 alkyl hydroperoxide reductase [Pedobacter sp. HMWF019]